MEHIEKINIYEQLATKINKKCTQSFHRSAKALKLSPRRLRRDKKANTRNRTKRSPANNGKLKKKKRKNKIQQHHRHTLTEKTICFANGLFRSRRVKIAPHSTGITSYYYANSRWSAVTHSSCSRILILSGSCNWEEPYANPCAPASGGFNPWLTSVQKR